MGGRGGEAGTSKAGVIGGTGTTGNSGGYPADGARRMPSTNSPGYLEAARNMRLQISARGGRTSTNLAGRSPIAGVQTYISNFLGSTG